MVNAAFQRSSVKSPRKLKDKQKTILTRLENWLLDDLVSFRKLDAFRKELNFDDEEFAKVLGVAVSTYKTWERNRKIPLRNRDKIHQQVVRVPVDQPCLSKHPIRGRWRHLFDPTLPGLRPFCNDTSCRFMGKNSASLHAPA